MEIYLLSFLSVIVVSLISLIGILILIISDKFLSKIIFSLVSLSVGALFAGAFLHLIPESEIFKSEPEIGALLILTGILFFFSLEKFLHWKHSHHLPQEEGIKPLGFINLIADGLHNFIDGLIIGAAFLIDVNVGLVTTVAIILHEIPQELGDFGVLIYSGFSKLKALVFNLLSASLAILGLFSAWLLATYSSWLIEAILPLAAGGFIYLAGCDLMPELHKVTDWRKSLWQFIMILLGIGIIFVFFIINH